MCHFSKCWYGVYWNLFYWLSTKMYFERFSWKVISFGLKKLSFHSIAIKNDAIGKGMQSYTVLCEMLTEATFNQTNFWFFWFFSPHFCDTILVLKFNMFIYARVDHSKFAIMYEDSSEFYRSTSKSDWYFISTLHRVKITIYLSNCLRADGCKHYYLWNKKKTELQ